MDHRVGRLIALAKQQPVTAIRDDGFALTVRPYAAATADSFFVMGGRPSNAARVGQNYD